MLNRTILSSLLFLISFLTFSQKKAVVINMTYREPYCGGARPTAEMEEEAQKARPYARKKIIVVAANGKVSSFKTDAKGILKLKLHAGTYRVYESWRYAKKAPKALPLNNFDTECLKLEWQKEAFLIKVGDNISIELKNEIILSCPWAIPCILDSFRPELPN